MAKNTRLSTAYWCAKWNLGELMPIRMVGLCWFSLMETWFLILHVTDMKRENDLAVLQGGRFCKMKAQVHQLHSIRDLEWNRWGMGENSCSTELGTSGPIVKSDQMIFASQSNGQCSWSMHIAWPEVGRNQALDTAQGSVIQKCLKTFCIPA